MAVWTSPFTAVTNTVVSSSDFNAGIRDNLLYLRQFLSADPGAADKVLVSSGAAAAGWTAMADPTILTAVKVAAATPLAASFTALQVANKSGFFEVNSPGSGGPTGAGTWYCFNLVETNVPTTHGVQIAIDINNPDEIYVHETIAGVPGAWRKIWTSGNDGSASNLDAHLLDGNSLGNGSGQVPVSNGALNVNLNAQMLGGSTLAQINQVPSGLGGFFATAGGIPSGWTRYSAADGRLLVGAGTTFGQTFTENNPVGANWTPFVGAAGFTGTAADAITVQAGTGASASATSHQNSLSIAAQTWIPVARVVVWATKT